VICTLLVSDDEETVTLFTKVIECASERIIWLSLQASPSGFAYTMSIPGFEFVSGHSINSIMEILSRQNFTVKNIVIFPLLRMNNKEERTFQNMTSAYPEILRDVLGSILYLLQKKSSKCLVSLEKIASFVVVPIMNHEKSDISQAHTDSEWAAWAVAQSYVQPFGIMRKAVLQFGIHELSEEAMNVVGYFLSEESVDIYGYVCTIS